MVEQKLKSEFMFSIVGHIGDQLETSPQDKSEKNWIARFHVSNNLLSSLEAFTRYSRLI